MIQLLILVTVSKLTFSWSFKYLCIYLICLEFPKKHSKILSDVNHEEEQGAHRAQKFMENCDMITELR